MITYEDDVWPSVQLHPWKYRLRNAQIDGIIWHATRGGQWYDGHTELRAFKNWVLSPNNRIADYAGIAHYGIGPGTCLRVVDETRYAAAWSSWPSDLHAVSVEVAQSNRNQPIEAETIERCVQFALDASATYNIPLIRAAAPANDNAWYGMIGHAETVQGRSSGKTDPDDMFWNPFMKRLEDVMKNINELVDRVARLERIVALWGGRTVTASKDNLAVLRRIAGPNIEVGQRVKLDGEKLLAYLDAMETNMLLGIALTQEEVAALKNEVAALKRAP